MLNVEADDTRQPRGMEQEDGEAERVLSTGFLVDEPHLSPDGGWLAYVSAESGRDEVYAEPYGRDGERVRVSVEGGGQPRWREDGQEPGCGCRLREPQQHFIRWQAGRAEDLG